MRYFPIFVDLDDRPVLVVGGGEKALQKLRLLTKTRARITLIAETIAPDLQKFATEAGVTVVTRSFVEADAAGQIMIFIAEDDPETATAIATAVRAAGHPVNVVDQPDASTFIMPAIVDRAPITVAIGSEGTAPILARELKSKIESWLPANFGEVARRSRALREKVHAAVSEPHQRRHVFERLLKGFWRDRVLAGDHDRAEQEFQREIELATTNATRSGLVSLIGCGPGDPDLLTLKAQQRLQEADVLVVDHLVNPAILEYARRDAVRFEAGKEGYGPSTPQDAINQMLVREAMKGLKVARLKGGDAFVFGRAAEEMAAVRAAGIEVEVIPGITAALACASSIGLPITLRQKIRQFSAVTGASADANLELDWVSLAKPGQAFAIYMGVRTAPLIRDRLLAAGADPATPAIIVENGSLATERSLATDLGLLAEAISAKDIRGPAVIFIGLDWADAQLTRPAKVEIWRPGPEPTAPTPPEPSDARTLS